jgi:hypothetical protein
MPLSKDDREFVRRLYRHVLDQALEPDDPFYEPIHEQLNEDDPVAIMQRRIELADAQTMQLFSGFSGSGKTTELFRLRRNLREQGYIVLYTDALKYVDPFDPLPIGDMLMVIAGAFSDAIKDDLGIDLHAESFWERLRGLVERSDVRLSGGEAKLDYSSPGHSVLGGIKAGLSIKAEQKTRSSFRGKLREFLSANLVQLQADVAQFFEDGAKAIWAAKGSEDVQIVFMLDQLEQLRGDYHNWQEVIRCVQQLFTVHLDRLRMPYVHCIYSVPAWLAFLSRPQDMTLLPNMTLLPTVRLWNKDNDRTPYPRGREMFRGLMRRRVSDTDCVRLFGPSDYAREAPIERLIVACGGQVRDLLRMMREVLTRANSLPVDQGVIDRVISVARRDFLPIAVDDARLLNDIGVKQNLEPEILDENAIERLSNFFNTHLVMYFENGESWYDTHPLIRDEVERIVADNRPT